jgi:hypothetical protein
VRVALVGCALSAHSLALAQPHPRAVALEAPMVCTHGPRARFHATLTSPGSAPAGSTINVRVDSVPSGKISQAGLFSISGMTTDFTLSPGGHVVDGSVHLVPGTGTPNVLAGARAWQDKAGLHLSLPAPVANGSSYTPPSFELALRLDAAPGAEVRLRFVHYAVKAKAFLVGTVETLCVPSPGSSASASINVGPAAAAGSPP